MIDLPPSLTEHEQVESLAYRLYEDEGKPDGRADEHWARAEQFIHAERLAIALTCFTLSLLIMSGQFIHAERLAIAFSSEKSEA